MAVELRPPVGTDVEACGRIIYDAFKSIADRHGFPPAISSIEVGTRFARLFLGLPAIWTRIAQSEGRMVGLIFLDEGDPIRGTIASTVSTSLPRSPGPT